MVIYLMQLKIGDDGSDQMWVRLRDMINTLQLCLVSLWGGRIYLKKSLIKPFEKVGSVRIANLSASLLLLIVTFNRF